MELASKVFLFILASALILFLLRFLLFGINKCKRCGSWDTEEILEKQYDSNMPGGLWQHEEVKCKKCGYIDVLRHFRIPLPPGHPID